jgi:hypothetical protein
MMDRGLRAEDIQELLRMNPMAAQQLETIVAVRERDEAIARLAECNPCTCSSDEQIPLPLEVN